MTSSSLADRASGALERLIGSLDIGEDRPGQREMCRAVAEAIESDEHLLVEAGTGTGKSLAYLVPAVLSGRRVVVTTATKALQDQLVRKDIPFVREHLDADFEAAVLKGRANYLCLARLAEASEAGVHDSQLKLIRPSVVQEVVPELVEWAETADAGERDDLPVDVSALLWDALTVSPRECPGARRCPHGDGCFAEIARAQALEADLVVVNTHLYCLDLALDGALLGEHDAVIVDEAHQLEDTAASVFGLSVGPGRFSWLAGRAKEVLVPNAPEIEALDRLSKAFGRALGPLEGRRVDPGDGALADALVTAGQVLGEVLSTLRGLEIDGAAEGRRLRALQAADGLAQEVQAASALEADHVAWVEGSEYVNLRVAPVDVGPLLREHLFGGRTVVATSATLSVGGRLEPTAFGLGLREEGGWHGLRVESSFDFRRQGMLYCAAHLPDPRDDGFVDAAIDELAALIDAAGGRTLALFTSYRNLHAAAEKLRDRWDWPVLVQDDASRAALLEEFTSDEQSCLFATMAFWQGVDVPGDALRLVVLDKLPFGRPDEPLTQARREAAERLGRSGFEAVDLPRAARLLAQGAGRLIRTATDAGVVAVLDRRLAKARYRPAILDSLPPLKRSVDRDEVATFLRSLGSSASRPSS